MKTVKQKKLTGKVTKRHLEQVIEVTLLKADVKEYRKEWAKHKAETRLDMKPMHKKVCVWSIERN